MFRSIKSLIRPMYRFASEAPQGTSKAVEKAKVKADTNKLTTYLNG